MSKKRQTIYLICMGFIGMSSAFSCKRDIALSGTDKELYELAIETNGYTWFQNSSVLLDKSAGSGHPQPFLRTRYNAIAATQLDSTGRIMVGSIFPEGSVVVKELRMNTSTIGQYAVLYKDAGHVDADARGWVWGYINADGTVAESASKKGSSCSGCHSQTDHIDYMLMNKYFPQ
jgi:hypothetical protein